MANTASGPTKSTKIMEGFLEQGGIMPIISWGDCILSAVCKGKRFEILAGSG